LHRSNPEPLMIRFTCRFMANSMTTPIDQQIFDWMAQAWEKLADLRKLDREPEPEA
jgi:hypothetical protein